jgi:hypothetical protein
VIGVVEEWGEGVGEVEGQCSGKETRKYLNLERWRARDSGQHKQREHLHRGINQGHLITGSDFCFVKPLLSPLPLFYPKLCNFSN